MARIADRIPREKLTGVWSAAPTPFTDRWDVDTRSIRRMVDHHVRLGVNGLFLAGTNGEGPWLTRSQRDRLVQSVVEHNRGRMLVAVQVTENSAPQILENVEACRESGADIAVLAPPYFLLNATPANLKELYITVIRSSSLPIGIYDRGAFATTVVPEAVLRSVYAEPGVILVKDSSRSETRRRIALSARRKRPGLALLNGYEFGCVEYLTAGYDGLLLGGGVFNGYLAGMIIQAVNSGDVKRAESLQRRMNRIMWAVYGGRKTGCWLSGEKKLLAELGIFRSWKNHLRYPLTAACVRAIERVLERDRDVLAPWESRGRG